MLCGGGLIAAEVGGQGRFVDVCCCVVVAWEGGEAVDWGRHGSSPLSEGWFGRASCKVVCLWGAGSDLYA